MRNEIAQMRGEHRMCRLWGHPWQPTTLVQEGSKYIQGLRCSRCSMECDVHVSRHGYANRRYRNRPKDYRIKGGLNPRERNQLRLLEVKSHGIK